MVLQEAQDDGKYQIHGKNPMMTDLKKLRDSNRIVSVSKIDFLVNVFGEYSARYLFCGTFKL
jgi:hypothetical protein